MHHDNIIAMIPARIGSTRLAKKNLALLDGKPLISYAIDAATSSGVFDRVMINSDHEIFSKIAFRYSAEFYARPKELGSSDTKSDMVVYDFMRKHPCDILCWVNPTSPLQTSEEIREVIHYFKENRLDSLITVDSRQVHCRCNDRPVNYNTDELFAKTQDLPPIQLFVYSLMIWRAKPFMTAFEQKGHAFFVGKVGFYPVSRLSSLIIKNKEDLQFAEHVLQSLKTTGNHEIAYDSVVEEI